MQKSYQLLSVSVNQFRDPPSRLNQDYATKLYSGQATWWEWKNIVFQSHAVQRTSHSLRKSYWKYTEGLSEKESQHLWILPLTG